VSVHRLSVGLTLDADAYHSLGVVVFRFREDAPVVIVLNTYRRGAGRLDTRLDGDAQTYRIQDTDYSE
jgi:hypothetical protein